MFEVLKSNFSALYPQIEKDFTDAKFIAFDCEFSALHPTVEDSLFDYGEERYEKARLNLEKVLPLQIGLTAFLYDHDECKYTARSYTFFLFPNNDETFNSQVSSFQFLAHHNFDFNKCFYDGVPYLSLKEEEELHELLENDTLIDHYELKLWQDQEDELEACTRKVSNWIVRSSVGDKQLLLFDSFSSILRYVLHYRLRKFFSGKIWTYDVNGGVEVRRISRYEYKTLTKENSLNIMWENYSRGFHTVYKLLKSLKKPLVGHNLLHDLVLLMTRFDGPLPKSYPAFKELVTNAFPVVFDTKFISFELKPSIPQNKLWISNSLNYLYLYFKDGEGRHLVKGQPPITVDVLDDQSIITMKFHNAGFDSYCTGYCFIRLAHIVASRNYENDGKDFYLNAELLHAINPYKNRLNLISAAVSYIRLDGYDPPSTRPPVLLVKTNGTLQFHQMKLLMGSYGNVHYKNYYNGKFLMAVPNKRIAQCIMQDFKSGKQLKIVPFNIVRHSPISVAVIWTSLIAASGITSWLLLS